MNKISNNNWNEYYKKVKKNPRKLLVKAIKYAKNKNYALDLGAGNLRDTRYLLKNKFMHIDAVDKSKEIYQFAKELNNEKITIYRMTFNKFNFDKKYDLINAQYSLPFMNKKDLFKVLPKIKKSLNKSGIFTGEFFGVRDSQNRDKSMTFLDIKEAKKIFNNLKLIYFYEEEKDGKTAIGEEKHWHIFHFIAKKK